MYRSATKRTGIKRVEENANVRFFLETQTTKQSLFHVPDGLHPGYSHSHHGLLWIIPTLIMVYCYTSIIRVIWLRSRNCRTPDDEDSNLDRPRIHFVSSHKAGAVMSASPDCRPYNHPRNTSAFRRATSFQPYQRRRPADTGPSSLSRFPLSSKRSVVKMTMLVVVGFVVCWTPYFVVSLIRISIMYYYQSDPHLFQLPHQTG